jgi:deoxyribonuclease V
MVTLIAILDAAYTENGAGVGCVLADDWPASAAVAQFAKCVSGAPQPYEPGAFYKRELPLLLAMIQGLPSKPQACVIDGYVSLGPEKPGLGAHLYDALGPDVLVIGVAKTPFRGDTWSTPVLRGQSKHLLHITSAGIDVGQAAALVAAMHGEHRIPTLLKLADRLARDAVPESGGRFTS